MSDDPDYLFALRLQQQLDAENEEPQAENAPQKEVDMDYELALMLQNEMNDANNSDDSVEALDMSNNNNNNNNDSNKSSGKDPPGRNGVTSSDTYLDQTQNLVHPEWELVDPNPDIYAMFGRFDEKFFQRRLGAVTVEWSKRMYSCAGICYQRGNIYVKTIIIRLSEPLLKLRPRKDLVETLLHEMIHAYCFVQNIIEGNGGHGPNFKRIMETINKVAGTNITVYHSFHDEVNAYKTHIWRCNGICQYHHPFQGWVKRTSNRAPGPSDQWWAKHQRECSGTFVKKSEPPKPPEKPSKADTKPKTKPKFKEQTSAKDIRTYFEKPPLPKEIVPNLLKTGNVAKNLPPTSYPGMSKNPLEGLQTYNHINKKVKTNGHNRIVGLKDLTGDDSDDSDNNQRNPEADQMQGQGYSLTNGKAGSSSSPVHDISDAAKRQNLREIWAKRFANNNANKSDSKEVPQNLENPKKRRRNSSDSTWETYDEEIMMREVPVPIINITDSEEEAEAPQQRIRPAVNQPSSQELTMMIKREIMEDESFFDDEDIVMIDDEYNDNADADDLTAASELADQSIIDDLFGEDTLLQEFQRENDVVPSGSRHMNDEANDITTCPICFDKMKRSEFANHLEGCSIIIRVPPPSMKGIFTKLSTTKNMNNEQTNKKQKRPTKSVVNSKSRKVEFLKSSGYSNADIEALNLSSSSDSSADTSKELTPRQIRQRGLYQNTTQCPKCGQLLLGHQIEAHRSICKRGKR